MLRSLSHALSVLIALVGFALPVQAAPAPIVFDFEDGLQGWELHGAATRVQTQILGGDWAIFGDGLGANSAFMSIEVDLTDIASISLERFLVEGDEDGLGAVVEANLIGNGVITAFFEFEIVDATNPNLLAANMASFATGPGVVQIRWNRFDFGALPSSAAFIDNITFHPVPEPSTLGLLAFGFAALVCARQRM